MIDVNEVMDEADALYAQTRQEQHRPQYNNYGIESAQVRIVAEVLVKHFNEALQEALRK